MTPAPSYDVVIVGSGIAGAMIAKQLGLAGKRVLIMEAGAGLPDGIEPELEKFLAASAKIPSAPYTPEILTDGAPTDPATLNAPRPTVLTLGAQSWNDPRQSYLVQRGPVAFASTYERTAGGTARLWLGTSLRNVPADFEMRTRYGTLLDWPIGYDDLEAWYRRAEAEIGVSADVDEQRYLGVRFPDDYQYPMPGLEPSHLDRAISERLHGLVIDDVALRVVGTPAGRNSRAYAGRPACSGSTSCVPICPTQAKYDPTVTLRDALATGNVELWSRTIACEVIVDEAGRVGGVAYKQYERSSGPETRAGVVHARVFVLAANAIETPKLLLMSTNRGRTPDGVGNRSGQVGRNLMDHPLYLTWGLMPEPVYPYRGPLTTSGIESLRDGQFREHRAAFRVEIGNVGWNFPLGDPNATTLDFVNGTDVTGLNPGRLSLTGRELIAALNQTLTRQFHLSFEVEQTPDPGNRVTLSDARDHLGLPRPEIHYDLSGYTRRGMITAKRAADAIFARLGARQFTEAPSGPGPCTIEVDNGGVTTLMKFWGSGHIAGTHRMGRSAADSVVDRDQRAWDHPNLFLVGSGVFPTIATANPTLTIAALALQAAETILRTDLAPLRVGTAQDRGDASSEQPCST
jgi:choline dehydrogenase-like flavoprotein